MVDTKSSSRNSAANNKNVSDHQLEKMAFVHISQMGGMVGGFSAVSNSQYIARTGLIQISKEETNGVLHQLQEGHTNTSALFDYLAKNADLLNHQETAEIKEQDLNLREYYPPKTLLCYLKTSKENSVCKYFEKDDISNAVRDFLNKAQTLIDQTSLSIAESGLYVRAQCIADWEGRFIKPKLVLEYVDLIAEGKLRNIIENEMSFVRVDMEAKNDTETEKLSFIPDKPFYIQISKDMYLLITYQYKHP
jgi:hypothetical protein